MPYVEKVGRGLRVKGLRFELVQPRSPEDYGRLSPETGLLPVLEVDGLRIPDSSAILDFLDERFPEPPLVSPDPRVAREQRNLEHWIDETFSFYILRWVRAKMGAAAPASPRGGGFPLGPMSRLGLIDSDGKLSPEVFDTSEGGPGPEFERRLDDLDQLLGPRPYFFADRPSRADLSVFATFYGMYLDLYPGSRELLATRPRLFAFVARMEAATGGPDAGRGGSLDRPGGSPP
jgi:glutathione S-transferase